jgi:stage IV sporulation protein B
MNASFMISVDTHLMYLQKIFEAGENKANVAKKEVLDAYEKFLLSDLEKIQDSLQNGTLTTSDLTRLADYSWYGHLSIAPYIYKTGLYVKSNVLGIGTLTYIDPNSRVYGVLGHSLNLSQTNQKIDVSTGYSYVADVIGFTKSTDGKPGSKNANIKKDKVLGTIDNNTNYGIFGIFNKTYNRELLRVGDINDIKLGKAFIRTTNDRDEIINYEIKILEINKNNSDKNIYFEIVDDKLIEMSGGIVQGMSGSPIIQGDYIVGAVTRVLIDDVSKGYGISIVTMLEEGDKILNDN